MPRPRNMALPDTEGAETRLDPRVERSRAAIIEAAQAAVLENGYRGLTIEDVSVRSGVAKTTIYRHWPDRAALLVDVFESLSTSQMVPDTGDVDADLRTALLGLAEGLRSAAWAGAMPSIIEAGERDDELRPLVVSFVERRRKPMRDRIAAAVRTGELPSGVEPDLAVAMLSGPLFYRRFITRQPVSPRVVDAIVTTVLAGLRA